jgi:hypothetical protein
MHLLSSEEHQYIRVIPSLESITIFKNHVVKLDLERDDLLNTKALSADDIKNRYSISDNNMTILSL